MDKKTYSKLIYSRFEKKEHQILAGRKIEILFETDNEFVIYCVKKLCNEIEFEEIDATLIATAASELTTNIIRYAQNGNIEIKIIRNEACENLGIEIYAYDSGPGIECIETAMEDCYTTSNNSLGFGLSSVKRIMDEFYIYSEKEEGTYVLVRKWNEKKGLND